MRGSVREVSPGRWELRLYLGRDPATGRHRTRSLTVSAADEDDARAQLASARFDAAAAAFEALLRRRLASYGMGDAVIGDVLDGVIGEFRADLAVTQEFDRTARRLTKASIDDDFEPHGCFVYLLRAADGEVLYVGQSTNVLNRLGSHLGDTVRFAMVARVQLIRCDDRQTMLVTERRLIELHQPRWNVVGVLNPVASPEAPHPRSRGRGPTTEGPGLTASAEAG